MRMTRMALFASLWLLCVGVVGAGSWYAIDSAGRTTQVLASDTRGSVAREVTSDSTTPAARTTSEPVERRSSDEPTSQSSDEPSDGTTSSTSASSSSSSSSTRPSEDGTDRSASPRPSNRTSSTPTPRTPTPPATTANARTLLEQTPGGSVTVTCRRGEPIGYFAKPAQGWGVRSNTQGTTDADIKFSDGEETYEIHAKCSDGEPVATVEHKKNDD